MKNKAFTLIELLVVIAIVSLLSSIIYASISSAKDKASTVAAAQQAEELKKAVEVSITSSSSIPPTLYNTDIATSISDSSSQQDAISETFSEVPNPPISSLYSETKYHIFTSSSGEAYWDTNGGNPNGIYDLKCGSTYAEPDADAEPDEYVVAYYEGEVCTGFCIGPGLDVTPMMWIYDENSNEIIDQDERVDNILYVRNRYNHENYGDGWGIYTTVPYHTVVWKCSNN